jgi:hypothetical protein
VQVAVRNMIHPFERGCKNQKSSVCNVSPCCLTLTSTWGVAVQL